VDGDVPEAERVPDRRRGAGQHVVGGDGTGEAAPRASLLFPLMTTATAQPHQDATMTQAAGTTIRIAPVRSRRVTDTAASVTRNGTSPIVAPNASVTDPATPGSAVGLATCG
jgi:hypothetical protein